MEDKTTLLVIIVTRCGIPPWETYIEYSTNPYMVGSIDDAGAFKYYRWNLYQLIHPILITDVR